MGDCNWEFKALLNKHGIIERALFQDGIAGVKASDFVDISTSVHIISGRLDGVDQVLDEVILLADANGFSPEHDLRPLPDQVFSDHQSKSSAGFQESSQDSSNSMNFALFGQDEEEEEGVIDGLSFDDIANIEPAAGDQLSPPVSSGRGFGFQSAFDPEQISPLNAIGRIVETELNYGLPFLEDEQGLESASDAGPTGPLSPEIKIGNAVVLEDSTVGFVAIAQPELSDGVLTIVISDIPFGWVLSDDAFDSAGNIIGAGVFDEVAGTWTYTTVAGTDFEGGPQFTPPFDSDVDALDLNFTVTESSAATGRTGTKSVQFNIIVDAVADAPEIVADDGRGVEGSALDVDLSALTGEVVNAAGGALDGSESIVRYEISGVPAGFNVSAGTETASGSGVYVLTPAELAGLTIKPDDPNFSGSIDLVATVFTTDVPTDGESDGTNNDKSASDPFTLTWTPVINPPTITVNNGIDGVVVLEDGTVEVPITASLGANPAVNEFLTVTISGIDPAWGFTGPAGSFNAVGDYVIVLPAGASLDDVLSFSPPADSDIDLSGLIATATATDPDAGISQSVDDGFSIIVDAVADAPDLDVSNASGEEGAVIALNISTNVTDTDGSEAIEVIRISGIPVGSTLTAGSFDTVNNVWLVDPDDLPGLGINVPDGVSGDFTLTVESVAFERNTSGGEPILDNNRASTIETLVLSVDVDDTPVIKNSSIDIDETDLVPTTFVDGVVLANFGDDAPGIFSGNGSFDVGGITSGGETIDVDFDSVSNTYTGTANGAPVFILVINSDGSYTFELQGTVDHPDATAPNDSVEFSFGVTATDSDGDPADGNIFVNILDDGPSVRDELVYAHEGDLAAGNPIIIQDTLRFGFGQDGAGTVKPNGDYIAQYTIGGAGVQLISGGFPVLVEVNAAGDGYVGFAGGEAVFTLVIDAFTGAYTYTQYAAVDHPELEPGGEVLWTTFGVNVTDGDGDIVIAEIMIDIFDSAPDAADDCEELDFSEGVLDGNVIDNDDISADAPNTITNIMFGDISVEVPQDGTYTQIEGKYGLLNINAAGDYSYEPFGDALASKYSFFDGNPSGSDTGGDIKSVETTYDEKDNSFTFEMKVEDIAQGFTVALNNGPNPKGHGGEMALFYFDASGVTPVISVYAYNGKNTQTSWFDGSAENGTQLADKILSSLSSPDVFTISETVDGEGFKVFSFSLDATDLIRHIPVYGPSGEWSGVSFSEEVGIWLHPVLGLETAYDSDGFLTQWDIEGQGWYDVAHKDTDVEKHPHVEDQFKYTLTDGDGDSDTALLKIKTNNDINDQPDAVDDCKDLAYSDCHIIGNVVDNDRLSDDAPNRVTQVRFGTEVVDLPGDGSQVTLNGEFGVLFIDNSGAYKYVAYDGLFDQSCVILNPSPPDVEGIQESFSRDGITVSVANDGDFDIVWLDTHDGSGLGIKNLDPKLNQNPKVWPKGEAFDISFDQLAQVVTLTISELGSNNNKGGYGLDYIVTLENGDKKSFEIEFDPAEIVDGHFRFSIDAHDPLVGGLISSVAINSIDEGAYKGASFLLNNVKAQGPVDLIVRDSFDYVLEDVDGDSDAAILSVKIINDSLVEFGGEGENILDGNSGNALYGGVGADVFVFDSLQTLPSVVLDFSAEQGDKIDFSSLLTEYDPLTEAIGDFVFVTERHGHTEVFVDPEGQGRSGMSQNVLVILEGVTGFDVDNSILSETLNV